MQDSKLRETSKVLDLDEQWARHPCYVRYDFQAPEDVPPALHHAFDCLVIDPPFVTRDVWAHYATTAKLLLRDGGKIICRCVSCCRSDL